MDDNWNNYVLHQNWRCPTLKKNVSSILIKINEIIEDRNEVNKIITNPFIETSQTRVWSFITRVLIIESNNITYNNLDAIKLLLIHDSGSN
ncbi:hypothetical protein DERF_010855 [Dermatophagoides farinae]|uniref:Uncharacterized protein n=1 Tax=Dermatophagoides farinae TaxID=6954 RepID=A0A922L488_DERFA|nr:hypothetical protein DERF_010855 [Dermatophagoides farinae]